MAVALNGSWSRCDMVAQGTRKSSLILCLYPSPGLRFGEIVHMMLVHVSPVNQSAQDFSRSALIKLVVSSPLSKSLWARQWKTKGSCVHPCSSLACRLVEVGGDCVKILQQISILLAPLAVDVRQQVRL